MKFTKIALTSAILLATGSAMADTADGDLGTTSQGTVDVELTLTEKIKISGLKKIAVDEATGVGTGNACVYHRGNEDYKVTVLSTHPDGTKFRMQHKSVTTKYIDYTVNFASETVTHNTETDVTGANTSSETCGGTNNTVINVQADATQIANGLAGTYSDELTILVAPR